MKKEENSKAKKTRQKKIHVDIGKNDLIEEYDFFGSGRQEEPEIYETHDDEMRKHYLELAKKLGVEVDVPED